MHVLCFCTCADIKTNNQIPKIHWNTTITNKYSNISIFVSTLVYCNLWFSQGTYLGDTANLGSFKFIAISIQQQVKEATISSDQICCLMPLIRMNTRYWKAFTTTLPSNTLHKFLIQKLIVVYLLDYELPWWSGDHY